MNFSMKTEYALRALMEISDTQYTNSNPIHRKEIAKNQSIPLAYLEKILLSLKKDGIIQSSKGPGGGYSLARDRKDITLWDIHLAVESPMFEGEKCFPGLKSECTRISVCKIKNAWQSINNTIRESMQKFNLTNLSA